MRGSRDKILSVPGNVLQAYLLGTVDFEAALLLQRRLHYDIAGDRDQAAVIVSASTRQPLAREFLAYLKRPDISQHLHRFGFAAGR